MNSLLPTQVSGLDINLKVTNSRHLSDQQVVKNSDGIEKSFMDVLKKALLDVNDLQNNADNLSKLMITNPELVNIHDVTIALSKAEMGLTLFKSVTDKVIMAYREIINMR